MTRAGRSMRSVARRPPAHDTSSTPERIAAAIVRGILERRYKPGARMTEAELTHAFGVGRGTAREAFRILAASGAIDLTRHRGAVIRTLSEADCRDLLEVTEVLLGLAARKAAANIELPGNRARFEAVAGALRLRHSGRQLASVLDERLDFYNAMTSVAANRELNRAMPLARAQIFRAQYYEYLTPSDLRAMVTEYRAIVDAILAGDERNAERRMRRHVRRTGERLLPRLGRQPAERMAA